MPIVFTLNCNRQGYLIMEYNWLSFEIQKMASFALSWLFKWADPTQLVKSPLLDPPLTISIGTSQGAYKRHIT